MGAEVRVPEIHGQWTGNWQACLNQELTIEEIAWIRQNLSTGRPTATREFVNELEQEPVN